MPHRFAAGRSAGPWSPCVLALAVLAAGAPARATDKYAAEFLRVGAGARALGMGGAFLAVPTTPPRATGTRPASTT
jgi:hypothetical protein